MSVRRLALCLAVTSASALAQTAPLHLIPMPRSVSFRSDISLAQGVTVLCDACDADDTFAAADLRQTLTDRHVPTGSAVRIVLTRFAKHPDSTWTAPMQAEGYTIAWTPGTLTLTGATPEGVFYAAQTAKQLIETNTQGALVLHAADIRDWPAMKYRGLHDDLSRGPVDTLEFQKKIVRTLAAYKANLYSPYFEHTMQYASNPLAAPPGGSMSPADALELVAYARQFHVMVVPEQEAFGHLHHNLTYDQYAPLAETPHGTVLAPAQAGSLEMIKQMFGELAAEYPSPFLHVGADETEDLGLGQTKAAVDARGLGPVYLDFMQQIDTALRPLNRRLLFWGDIAERSPELLKAMPEQFKKDTIAISWHYSPLASGFTKYLKYFTSAGFETWVAPGINNWNRIYPNWNDGLANIQQFTRDGQAVGADGQLNTIWYDDGEALATNNWYGILFGAAAAWQQGESPIAPFEDSYAQVFHGDTTGKLNEAQRELMQCHEILRHQAHVGDGSDGLFWMDPWSKDGQNYAAKLRPYNKEMRLHAERALTLIAEARAAAPAASTPVVYTPTEQLPANPTSLRETDAIDALELGARRLDFVGLKFELADEIAEQYAQLEAEQNASATDKKLHLRMWLDLAGINGVNGRIQDIIGRYAMLRDLYQQQWLRSNRPYALRPILEHYDYTINYWYQRSDKLRASQRQFDSTNVLIPAAEIGIPAPPTTPAPAQ